MYGYLLQDWITIRGTQSGVTIIQSEADWLSLQPYQDVVMWLEVKSVTLGGIGGAGTFLAGGRASGSGSLNGQIAELIVAADVALSDAQFDSIRSYFNARYALSLV